MLLVNRLPRAGGWPSRLGNVALQASVALLQCAAAHGHPAGLQEELLPACIDLGVVELVQAVVRASTLNFLFT